MKDNNLSHQTVHIYIDGSYHPKEGAGYGFIALDAKRQVLLYQEAEPVYNKDLQTNTSAELVASLRAVKWAERNGYRFVNIHHDFVGVREVAYRPSNRPHELHTTYHEFFRTRLGNLCHAPTRVFFHKVTSHTGNVFNEMADRLAWTGRKKGLRRTFLRLCKKQWSLLHFSPLLRRYFYGNLNLLAFCRLQFL